MLDSGSPADSPSSCHWHRIMKRTSYKCIESIEMPWDKVVTIEHSVSPRTPEGVPPGVVFIGLLWVEVVLQLAVLLHQLLEGLLSELRLCWLGGGATRAGAVGLLRLLGQLLGALLALVQNRTLCEVILILGNIGHVVVLGLPTPRPTLLPQVRVYHPIRSLTLFTSFLFSLKINNY